jgi:hypothetical protein
MLRAVFVGPDLIGAQIDGDPLHVAMPVAPDLRERARRVHEGVVGRDGAVVTQAHDLAVMRSEILCGVLHQRVNRPRRHHLTVAEGDEEIPVAVEGETRPVVPHSAGPVLRDEDLLHVGELVVREARADDGRRALRPILARLGEAEVDEPVLREARVRDDVEEATLAADTDLRDAGDRGRQESTAADDPQGAAALGDQEVATRKEGHRPGADESLSDGDDAVVVLAGALDVLRVRNDGREQEGGEGASEADVCHGGIQVGTAG